MLSLVAPYTAEEMWERLGHEPTVARAGWPAVDESLLVEDTVTAIVQVQGKLRARLEVPPSISAADLEAAGAGRPGRRAQPGGQDGPQGDRARAEPGQRRRRLTPAPGSASRSRHAEGRRRHRLHGVAAARRWPTEHGIVVVPLQVVDRRAAPTTTASTPRRARRTSPRRSRSSSRSAPRGPARPRCSRPTSAPRPTGAEEIVSVHVSARGERDLRVGAARCAGSRRCRCTPSTAGRSAPAPASPRWPRPRWSPRAATGATRPRPRAAGPRTTVVAVLRRHAGVPPPRRPGRRGRCAARLGARGQADPADRGRTDRAAGEGAHLRSGAGPARGARGRGRRGAGRRRRRSATWPGAGPAQALADALAERLADQPRRRRGRGRRGAGGRSAPTSAPGWSASRSPRAERRPDAVLHRLRSVRRGGTRP